MHGSKERTTCCTTNGEVSPAATGKPASACSSAPGWPGSITRGEIPGCRRNDLVAGDLAAPRWKASDRAHRAPASTRPMPVASPAPSIVRRRLARHDCCSQRSICGSRRATSTKRATMRALTLAPPAIMSHASGCPVSTCRARAPVSTTCPRSEAPCTRCRPRPCRRASDVFHRVPAARHHRRPARRG